jgi:hypothetical protein
MAEIKVPNTKTKLTQADDAALLSKADHEDEIINLMVNISVLLMSTVMGAFSQVMINVADSMVSGISEVMGGKETGDKVGTEIKHNLPEVDEKMMAMISDLRKDIYAQMEQKKQEMEPLLSYSVFEVGPKIIGKYDFKLPKLTQKLHDNVLAKYSQLLMSGDVRFAKMFKELTKWLNSLPKPPETNHK